MQMPQLSKGQMAFVCLLALAWLYYLVATTPSYATVEGKPKQLSPMKTVLAYVLGVVVSYLLVIVFSKLMRKKGQSGMMGGGMNSMGGAPMMDDSMTDSSDMSPDVMPKAGAKGMM